MSDQPTISISLSRKVNLGNYESADVFISCSGVPEGASEEDIRKLLDTGNLAYKVIREELAGKVAELRDSVKKTA